ncbi:hypothetical protein LMG28690_02001 [Paraburkholderia caffeinilytica]|nr:hypothetical protein LMG28690_02001 [Paraburkholderia caffeinilytica]
MFSQPSHNARVVPRSGDSVTFEPMRVRRGQRPRRTFDTQLACRGQGFQQEAGLVRTRVAGTMHQNSLRRYENHTAKRVPDSRLLTVRRHS